MHKWKSQIEIYISQILLNNIFPTLDYSDINKYIQNDSNYKVTDPYDKLQTYFNYVIQTRSISYKDSNKKTHSIIITKFLEYSFVLKNIINQRYNNVQSDYIYYRIQKNLVSINNTLGKDVIKVFHTKNICVTQLISEEEIQKDRVFFQKYHLNQLYQDGIETLNYNDCVCIRIIDHKSVNTKLNGNILFSLPAYTLYINSNFADRNIRQKYGPDGHISCLLFDNIHNGVYYFDSSNQITFIKKTIRVRTIYDKNSDFEFDFDSVQYCFEKLMEYYVKSLSTKYKYIFLNDVYKYIIREYDNFIDSKIQNILKVTPFDQCSDLIKYYDTRKGHVIELYDMCINKNIEKEFGLNGFCYVFVILFAHLMYSNLKNDKTISTLKNIANIYMNILLELKPAIIDGVMINNKLTDGVFLHHDYGLRKDFNDMSIKNKKYNMYTLLQIFSDSISSENMFDNNVTTNRVNGNNILLLNNNKIKNKERYPILFSPLEIFILLYSTYIYGILTTNCKPLYTHIIKNIDKRNVSKGVKNYKEIKGGSTNGYKNINFVYLIIIILICIFMYMWINDMTLYKNPKIQIII